MFPFKKNQPAWSYDEIIIDLYNFYEIYKNRPIQKNQGGMFFAHMFALHFILKKINPELVVESGIFKGQSSWLIENTLPKAKIISIDLNLKDMYSGNCWGVPSFKVTDEDGSNPFYAWGQDRIWLIKEEINKRL